MKTDMPKEELDEKVQPTYKGKNIDCTFKGTTKLFDVTPQAGEVISRETAREFSRSIRNTFKTWNLARISKYGNVDKNGEALSRTDTTPALEDRLVPRKRSLLLAYAIPRTQPLLNISGFPWQRSIFALRDLGGHQNRQRG